MTRVTMYLGQAVILFGLSWAIAYFASAPAYQHFPADQALIKLTFIHGGDYVGGCRERTAEELEELAPNMRRRLECPRDRESVVVEIDVDGLMVHRAVIPPSGLHNDGPSVFYEGFPVTAGPHTIDVRLSDSGRTSGFDYSDTLTVDLVPAQLLVVQFRPELGGFVYR